MTTYGVLGRVGLPLPELAAAAYLARAGKAVLVLERRDRLGGACTLEQPFADQAYLVGPCAYVVGRLDPLVIEELDLPRRGYRAHVADPSMWCPFDDETPLASWKDPSPHRRLLEADSRRRALMRIGAEAELRLRVRRSCSGGCAPRPPRRCQ